MHRSLRKSLNHPKSLTTHYFPLQLSSAARPDHDVNSPELRSLNQGRRMEQQEDRPKEQVQGVLRGRSVPVSLLHHSALNCSLHIPHRKVQTFLPHTSGLRHLQEKLLNFRGFAAAAGSEADSDDEDAENGEEEKKAAADPKVVEHACKVFDELFESDRNMEAVLDKCAGSETDSDDEDAENGGEGKKAAADPKEVEHVCKVIDELFELDRNMEAVLNECDVNVTHDLVVEVLNRFRHARKPALRFFSWAGRKPGFTHDSRTYNKMMEILGKTRQFETMVSVLEEMGEKSLLTMETFTIAIKAFAASKERKKAIGVFELMKKYKYKVGAETINCLLDALGRAKLGKEAYTLFEKLKERFTPDLRTYTVLLNGFCRVRNLMEAGRIWNEMVELGLNPDIIAHNTMIEGLIRCQKRSDAIKLFMVMKSKGPAPNVRSFTILIRDFCKQGKMREAVEYFDEMVELGFQPDTAVYTCLITGFGNQKRMDMVYGFLKEMKEKGCPPDGKTYNALIKLMTNRKMPDDAVSLYKKMIQSGIEPSIHSYNMMMRSYFQIRNYEMGHAVWDEMRQKGCCPDENSYTVLIAGLISNGRSEEACRFLEEMLEKGMKAPQLDYNKFAADFSRAGRPDILEELAKKMKFSGKFEVANVFARWSEMMKKRVKRRDPVRYS